MRAVFAALGRPRGIAVVVLVTSALQAAAVTFSTRASGAESVCFLFADMTIVSLCARPRRRRKEVSDRSVQPT